MFIIMVEAQMCTKPEIVILQSCKIRSQLRWLNAERSEVASGWPFVLICDEISALCYSVLVHSDIVNLKTFNLNHNIGAFHEREAEWTKCNDEK